MKLKLVEEYLFEMSNIRGNKIKIEDIDFSFYFSSKSNVDCRHGIRVKICWNKEKLSPSLLDGYMELHGNYKYVSKENPNYKPNKYDIATAQYFFRRYKVLFSAVWEEKLDENVLNDYLRGIINFEELLNEFENILPENKDKIKKAKDRKELEKIVRENNIYNMND